MRRARFQPAIHLASVLLLAITPAFQGCQPGGVECNDGEPCDGREALCDGGAVADGETETRYCYDAASVSPESICTFTVQTRQCNHGVFSPDWPACDFTTCEVEGHASCGTIPHGGTQTRPCYTSVTVPYGSSCSSSTQTRVCSNGVWDPNYPFCAFLTCTVDPATTVPLESIFLNSGSGTSTTIPNSVQNTVAYSPSNATDKSLVWTVCMAQPTACSPDTSGRCRTCAAAGSLGTVTDDGLYTPPASIAASPTSVHLLACQGSAPAAICDWTVVEVSAGSGEWIINPTPLVKLTQPTQSLPAEMETVPNVFGSVTTTVTKRISDTQPQYATSMSWNADMTLLRLRNGVVLDARTFALSSYTTSGCGPNHRTWSSIDPDYCYGSGDGGRWVKKNVKTNTIYYSTASGWTTTNTTRSYPSIGTDYVFAMNGEGESLDNYDTAAALVNNASTAVQVIDPKTGDPKCSVTGLSSVDNARVSRSGVYVMIQASTGVESYQITASGTCPHIRNVYTSSGGHWDACTDIHGDDVVVASTGAMVRISDGRSTVVWAASPASPKQTHISCTNRARPGFAYFGDQSTDGRVTESDFYNRCWAVRLDPAVSYVAGTTDVENWLWQHHPIPAATQGGAYCSPSPDGRFVLFGAEWNGDSAKRSFVAFVP